MARRNRRRAFTLVEILVVIAIVMLASIVALPVLAPLLNGRHLNEAARIFTASLAGVKDAAIRANEPRGLRLLPDPTMTMPALGTANAGTVQLCYNRMLPIEPAADYREGMVLIGPQVSATAAASMTGWPPAYPRGGTYGPLFPLSGAGTASVLMVEESPFTGGYQTSGAPNDPANWYWNVRLGDKIQVGGSGQFYTIVGPCTINPWTNAGQNPELFVNVGPPGTTPPLVRTYFTSAGTVAAKFTPEFLFLVNGQDDNTNGWVDEGWDGYNQSTTTGTDDLTEWEPEKWTGTRGNPPPDTDPFGLGVSPSAKWLGDNPNFVNEVEYTIQRRPVPTAGAREIFLPSSVVIDATGALPLNNVVTNERSQILIDSGSLYCDVMMDPNGLFIPTTAYSTPTTGSASPFLHFWLTDKGDVYPRGTVWGIGSNGVPKPNPTNTATKTYYELPMPKGSPNYGGSVYLENDRRIVTYFTRTGLVTTNSIEQTTAPASPLLPGEGFDGNDVNQPFYNARLGIKEVK